VVHRIAQLTFLLALGQLLWTPISQPPSAQTIVLDPACFARTWADLEDDADFCPDAARLRVVVTPVPSQTMRSQGTPRELEVPARHEPGRNLPLRLGGADADADPASADPDHS